MKQPKKIPTIFGLVLLLVAVFGGVILTSQKSSFGSKAGGSCEPINPQITNTTYKSVSISFTTSSECQSSININNQLIKNDSSSKTHYFEVDSLKENSDYIFSIISGGNTYSSSNYQISTAQKPANDTASSNLAWGKVINSSGSPVEKAIVYLNIPGAAPLSAITTSSGNWNIPLSTSFNDNKTNWFTPPANIEENIYVLASDQSVTQIVSNTSSNNPVADIIIGQDNFNSPKVDTTSVGSLPETNTGNINTNKNLDISNPSQNETLNTKKPQFFGSAPSNSEITIEVHSAELIAGQTVSDEDGTWEWSVPKDLSPGEHTITVTAKNKTTGLIESITRKFVVLAAEGETSFTASSSATTPTPTIAPTDTPTPTPTTAVRVENPDTSSGVPTTGAVLPTLVMIISAITLVAIGLVFYSKS